MTRETAEFLVAAAGGYGLAGLLVGIGFLLVGLDRVEPAARGAYGVRPLMLPGLVLLWPWVALRWASLLRRGR
jgi:hypothetical protein